MYLHACRFIDTAPPRGSQTPAPPLAWTAHTDPATPPRDADGGSRGGRFGQGCAKFDPAQWPFALRDAAAAEVYRERAFRRARLPPPPPLDSPEPIPRQITVLSAPEGEAISNYVRYCLVRCRYPARYPARAPWLSECPGPRCRHAVTRAATTEHSGKFRGSW